MPWLNNIPDLDGALCSQADPEVFFPETGRKDVTREAKQICGRCPVVDACLAAHLHERYGVWGGLTAHERASLRTKKGIRA